MCNFFSFISSGTGNILYFDGKQRRNKATLKDGSIPNYDSHTSIATFYGHAGKKEDVWNKWEYNPFTDRLVLDKQNTADDREAIQRKLLAMDWGGLCGDVESVKALLAQIPTIPWFQNSGKLPEGVRLFQSRDAAGYAARDAVWNAAGNAAEYAAGNAAEYAARDATGDAALLAQLYVCSGLGIDPKHMEHAKLRWSVWEAGYGVLCDVNGVIYAYEKPQEAAA